MQLTLWEHIPHSEPHANVLGNKGYLVAIPKPVFKEISPVMAGNAVVKSPVLRSPVVKLEESPTVHKVNSLINSTKLPYLHVVKHLPLIHKYLLWNNSASDIWRNIVCFKSNNKKKLHSWVFQKQSVWFYLLHVLANKKFVITNNFISETVNTENLM